ncbi:S8 family serine peptidase [Ahniella affigens]|nr:S8 family serine peptidase [Ahniella affigens]
MNLVESSRALRRVAALTWLILFAIAPLSLVRAAPTSEWADKVDADLRQLAKSDRQAVVPVLISIHTPNVPVPRPPVELAQRQAFVAALKAASAAAQAPVLKGLEARGLKPTSYWVGQAIAVELPSAELEWLASQSSVKHVHRDRHLTVEADISERNPTLAKDSVCSNAGAPTWGVDRVQAPAVWAQGFTGQGVVVAGADTGYQWNHPALIGKYRGWNGATADHHYNWWDAIRSGSNTTCGVASPQPCDDNSHGTHTMGTMVGDAGGGNAIGVAPGAKWIACRNMNSGNGTMSSYNSCFQFFLEPTRLDGSAGNTALAPNVINNSWGCPTDEGCNTANFVQMETVINTLQAAGILVVGSAGNSGSACSTIDTPLAIFSATFTVGNSNIGDSMEASSSRGPVTVDSSNRMKPEISAPGSSICSSVPGNGYGLKNGTSMAGPHIAGVAALLMSANPSLRGNPEAVKQAIIGTAAPILGISQNCGGLATTDVPNNVGGYGRVDAFAAFQLVAGSMYRDGFE